MTIYAMFNKNKDHYTGLCNKVKNRDQTIYQFDPLEMDIWAPSYLLAKESDHDSVQFMLANPSELSDVFLCGAIIGYMEVGLVDQAKALLLRFDSTDNKTMFNAISGNVNDVNALLEAGASKEAAIFGYALAGNISQMESLLGDADDDRDIFVPLTATGCYENPERLMCILAKINNPELRLSLYRYLKYHLQSELEVDTILKCAIRLNDTMNAYHLDYAQALNLNESVRVWLLQGGKLDVPSLVYKNISSYVLGVGDSSVKAIQEKINCELLTKENERIDEKYHGTCLSRVMTTLFYKNDYEHEKTLAQQRFESRALSR